MIEEFEVKIIRFKTGEDIIAFVHEDKKELTVRYPKVFYFNYDYDTNEEELVLIDWMSKRAFGTQEVTFLKSEILFCTVPTLLFGYQYLNKVTDGLNPESDLAKAINEMLETLQ